ncbi:hypothetical protein B9T25_06470 [Acinetobacter sp. ANC 4470]|uniref:hypothetical protein n=1 Tax=Acinetobacter sp. ANC 4470 TaxID=1977881 RepID=UPI000A356C05|nr:hypothetical protein [Acinetobacter sp. ANC 4470]OTG68322.1 hypothetical protein B9T25_06470 [Acinetobacter sp. ANC 4470]
MSNIALKVFWSNNPMPVDQKIKQSEIVINTPFGVMIAHPNQPVKSVNNKTGEIVLNAADVNADVFGSAVAVNDALEPKIQNLSENKLDKVDYVQHFRGLFSSYISLNEALPVALDGDYAHIDSGSGFDRMSAIWDSNDSKWIVNAVNVGTNSDEIPEGAINLYFKGERVRQTPLTGLTAQQPSPVVSTDTLLNSIAKLQAQIDNPPKIKWMTIHEISDVVFSGITYEQYGDSALKFAVIGGILFATGRFYLSVISSSSNVLCSLKPKYKVMNSFGSNGNNLIDVNVYSTFSGLAQRVYISNPTAVSILTIADTLTVQQQIRADMGTNEYVISGNFGKVLQY